MSSKIGVYFDQQNIGGGLVVEAHAAPTPAKWGTLAAGVMVVPVLASALGAGERAAVCMAGEVGGR